jgi:hypothetical protein
MAWMRLVRRVCSNYRSQRTTLASSCTLSRTSCHLRTGLIRTGLIRTGLIPTRLIPTVLMPTRPRRNVCSAFVRGHRFAEDELAAKPKLLPGALALRTDAVCVLSYRPLDLRFVLAVRADHPWTELQRRHIEQDRDNQTDNNYRHRVTALRSSITLSWCRKPDTTDRPAEQTAAGLSEAPTLDALPSGGAHLADRQAGPASIDVFRGRRLRIAHVDPQRAGRTEQ